MTDMTDTTRYELPPLVGTLANLPPHVGEVVLAYGKACARIAAASVEPAPAAPTSAIGAMLKELMDIAVANGANSVSMPDHLVEVAAWLASSPPSHGRQRGRMPQMRRRHASGCCY